MVSSLINKLYHVLNDEIASIFESKNKCITLVSVTSFYVLALIALIFYLSFNTVILCEVKLPDGTNFAVATNCVTLLITHEVALFVKKQNENLWSVYCIDEEDFLWFNVSIKYDDENGQVLVYNNNILRGVFHTKEDYLFDNKYRSNVYSTYQLNNIKDWQ